MTRFPCLADNPGKLTQAEANCIWTWVDWQVDYVQEQLVRDGWMIKCEWDGEFWMEGENQTGNVWEFACRNGVVKIDGSQYIPMIAYLLAHSLRGMVPLYIQANKEHK